MVAEFLLSKDEEPHGRDAVRLQCPFEPIDVAAGLVVERHFLNHARAIYRCGKHSNTGAQMNRGGA
uniref:Uncharacterized protein n=1 Tax=Arundo donax TaxID=35708 RepID=A0A0A9EKG6_ARUDO